MAYYAPTTNPRRREKLNFAGSSKKSRSTNVSAQTCINFYPEILKKPEKSNIVLYPTPGITHIQDVGLGPHRGAINHVNAAYYVSGNELIQQNTSNVFTTVGTLSTSTGRVGMASNGTFGNQIIIVDGTYGYIYNSSTNTFSTITDPQFPVAPTQVVYLDSYFIIIEGNSGQFNISASVDGLNWDALDFANAERNPDNCVSIQTLGRDLYFVGLDTTEIWTNTGGTFPYEPYTNGVIEFGSPAAWSVAKTEDSIIFVTSNERGQGKVVTIRGTNYQVISNPALEYELSTYTLDNAYAFTYEQAGHVFYQVTFPTNEKTWVFDMTINDSELGWHQRSTNSLRHAAGTHVFFNGHNYIGSYLDSSVYYYDLNNYLDDINPIIRERAGLHIQDTRQRFRYISLELEFEAGVGLITGQGSDPQVMLDWSDDGGHTWSNVRYISIGGIGAYKTRALTHHLGAARDRIFRVRMSDPVKYVLINAYAEIEELWH